MRNINARKRNLGLLRSPHKALAVVLQNCDNKLLMPIETATDILVKSQFGLLVKVPG